jgi:hypothetical protein
MQCRETNAVLYCKSNAIPVTGLGGLKGCETSRLPYFLDNRHTDGGEVFSIIRRPAALYPHEDSCYSFLLETLGAIVRLEVLGQLKNRVTSSGIEPAIFLLVA